MTPAPINDLARFDIAAGSLRDALNAWIAQSHRDLIYSADEIGTTRTKGVRGRVHPSVALATLLRGTGFHAQLDSSGAVAVVREKNETALDATPDILVQGKRDWSLNLGIERTRNDSQPFIVLTAEQIKRSGAPDLETFLRNQLTVNATAGTSRQGGLDGGVIDRDSDRISRSLTQVNLRGLGSRETLILVDGRRQPGVNLGNGTFGQPQISGIPLAAIERIEVLASSASAIYGSGASGGAINIVLKRSYSGGVLTATYGNTTDFKAGEGRIDGSYSKTLEGGRTNISLSGSWRKSLPLLYKDRIWIRDQNLAESIRLAGGDAFAAFDYPPSATTPNIRSADNAPLQLKPQYGGQVLSSRYAYVPVGYRGLSLDGVAPLLKTIGQYNLQAPPGVQNGGLDAPLIYGSQMISGLLSVRREMNSWMTLYVQGQGSRTTSSTITSRGISSLTLDASAPENPFTSKINLSLPTNGASQYARNEMTQWSVVGGGIFKLPYEWQVNLDNTYSSSRYLVPPLASNVTRDFYSSLTDGSINVLRDVTKYPISYVFNTDELFRLSPVKSSNLTTSLRASGPLPLKMPGGKAQITVNIERSQDRLGPAVFASNAGFFSGVSYRPTGSYTLLSAYGELALPIIGPANNVPFVHLFDIRLSARRESYTAVGADIPVVCYLGLNYPSRAVIDACPPAGWVDPRNTSKRSHVDPMVSARWQPSADVMFRASYGTGYLPPTLAQITRHVDLIQVSLYDPKRNFEPVGQLADDGYRYLQVAYGGNPDVKPETSKTLTAGIVLTPRVIPNLRFSADWTRIVKKNNFFDPYAFALAGGNFTGDPNDPQLREFARYETLRPERVTRGPASDGFPVGPITFLDVSLSNYVGTRVEAVDFALDYWHDLFGGRLDLDGALTWNRTLEIETFPGQVANYIGTNGGESAIAGGPGSLRWRGNGSIRWSGKAVMVGVQALFYDRYFLNTDRSVYGPQGSATVPSQAYFNMMFSYSFDAGLTLRGTINNVLNKTPPRDASVGPLFYSRFGDPLGRNFLLSVSKTF